MEILFERHLTDRRIARVGCTDKFDGDLSISTTAAPELSRRRASIVPLPWAVSRQVHSDRVVTVEQDVTSMCSTTETPIADATMTSLSNHVVAAHSADCVPVGFVHHGGSVAAAHAGWKGLERGVLESTVRSLRSRAGGTIEAVVGPHIRVTNYEFGVDQLTDLQRRFGSEVVGTTGAGTPALDLTKAVKAELDRLGINVSVVHPECTAENDTRFWSYRARRESGRFALVAWISNE